jgi:predicted dienelactone hydrolase
MLRAIMRLPPRLALAFAATCALLAGCGHDEHTADFIAAGQYGIGVHTFTFVDSSRPTPANHSYPGAPDRTLVVEVWYPSTTEGGPYTDPPLAPGAFPLVLHSHGFMDGRRGESYLGEHLASHGYVMAAPDYPLSNFGAPGGATIEDTPEQPLDARFVIDRLLEQSADPSSPIGGAIDADHIVASGLSLGGLTTLLLAYHPTLRDPRIRAALAIAAPSCMLEAPFFAGADVPLVLLHGDVDAIVPVAENSERIFDLTPAGTELILLANGSHTGFAGPASLLDPSMSFDQFGCQALGDTVNVTSFAGLGSAAQGISQDPAVCPMPCQATPTAPSLAADRQHELTQAIALAFFDSVLGRDAQAQPFLRARLAAENPEVRVQLRPGAASPGHAAAR